MPSLWPFLQVLQRTIARRPCMRSLCGSAQGSFHWEKSLNPTQCCSFKWSFQPGQSAGENFLPVRSTQLSWPCSVFWWHFETKILHSSLLSPDVQSCCTWTLNPSLSHKVLNNLILLQSCCWVRWKPQEMSQFAAGPDSASYKHTLWVFQKRKRWKSLSSVTRGRTKGPSEYQTQSLLLF